MNLSNLLKSTRQYFWKNNFDEIEIPYLNSSLPLEPNIYPFSTIWMHSQAKFYLPTSPEMALKQHLAESKKNCFAISHCFRDLESEGPHHTKEFLMLEWYEVGKTYLDIMDSVKKYISQFIDIKFSNLTLPSNLPDNEPDFNQYFLNEIEPNLPRQGGVFITGYPAFLSPLAAIDEVNNFSEHSECVTRSGQPEGSEHRKNLFTSQRFELYINGIEIANACTENRDSEQIRQIFETENQYRLSSHLPTHPISEDFINNCSKIPPSAGIGFGLERFLTII